MQTRNELSQRKQDLSVLKRKLLEKRIHHGSTGETAPNTISRRPDSTQAPLSFAQQRLWSLQQSVPGSTAYNELFAMHMVGTLNVPVLTQALGEIAQRHEILRTTFVATEGLVHQVIAPRTPGDQMLLPVDLCNIAASRRKAVIQDKVIDEVHHLFDLTTGPLWKATLLHMSEEEHVLLIVMHHIITDGWSMSILARELEAIYAAFITGQPSPLPAPMIQYADYACWQRQRLQEGKLDKDLIYWKRQLGDTLPVLELSKDRPYSIDQTYRGRRRAFTITRSLSQNLQALSRQEGVSLFMTLLAAFKVVLYHHTTQEDLAVGVPVACRTSAELEGVPGLFANTLVLRSKLSKDAGFLEFLQQIRQIALGAYEHQEMPFEKLVEELQPQHGLGQLPLFRVMFILQNVPAITEHWPGLTVTPIEMDNDTAKFDLMLSIQETQQQLRGFLEYKSDLFDECTIDCLLEHFRGSLERIVVDPSQRIKDLCDVALTDRR